MKVNDTESKGIQKNEIKIVIKISESSLHLQMGSTVMLKTVGAEGAGG